jgi:phage terminase large subunit
MEIALPIWARPLIHEKRRYKVLHGGRGGGKSTAAAISLLLLGAQRPLRILCAREVQKSIRDSVHRLLSDLIKKMRLAHFYQITNTEIRGKNGTLFIFSGLQDHTVDQIKSFEGCEIVWVEEAHCVSRKSWDVLIPTIRAEGSEIWMTLNPNMDTDDTYIRFVAQDSPDTWRKEVNWRDNPRFPDTLNLERIKFKKTHPVDEYEHIWEGKPRRVSDGAIYRLEVAALYNENRVTNLPHDPMMPVHTVWDLGWNDSTSIIMCQKGLQEIRVIDYIEDNCQTLAWYVGQLNTRPYLWGSDFLPHDGMNKNVHTGKDARQILKDLGRKEVHALRAMPIENGIRLTRMVLPRLYFDEQKTARLLECLKRYRRDTHQKTGEPNIPLHDEYSHGADALRYLAMSIELMNNDNADYQEQDYLPDWRTA